MFCEYSFELFALGVLYTARITRQTGPKLIGMLMFYKTRVSLDKPGPTHRHAGSDTNESS